MRLTAAATPVSRPAPAALRLAVYVATALAPLGTAGEGAAQAVVGRVLDASSGAPIRTAEVALLDSAGVVAGLALTDGDGRFAIRVARDGVYRLEANAPGYAPLGTDSLEVVRPEIVTVELRLGVRPIELDGIEVVTERSVPAPLADYYWRLQRSRSMGFTTMLDRAQLAELEGQSARAVVSSRAFTRISTRGGAPRLLLRNRGHGGGYCEPAYFLDDMPVDPLTILMMPVRDLEGIEIDRTRGCGTVRAWIRRTPDPSVDPGPEATRPGTEPPERRNGRSSRGMPTVSIYMKTECLFVWIATVSWLSARLRRALLTRCAPERR